MQTDPRRVATVALLRRFPLRSAGGEQPSRVWVGAGGLDGDRRFTLATTGGTPLSARDLPSLAAVRARLDHGELVLDVSLGDLSRAAGVPVVIHEEPPSSVAPRHSGGAAVHLVSDGAVGAPGTPVGCDPGERANVVLALDPAAGGAGAERSWVGSRLQLGGVELALTRTPSRCLGVYADVVTAGWLEVGDGAWLVAGPKEAAR